MTNEQTAILLEGYWAELGSAIARCDIVNDGEAHLLSLQKRIHQNIELLREERLGVEISGELQPVFPQDK